MLGILVYLLCSCKPVDLRAQAKSSITVEYTGDKCLPLESIIPADQEVTVTLSNSSEHAVTWLVIALPLDDKITLQDKENIRFQISADAGQNVQAEFTSPALTARYDSYCVSDNKEADPLLKYVLVVRPYK